MKKILVPCDFSEPSVEAMRFAADIARRSKGEILLLNTIELPALYDSSAVLAFESEYMVNMKGNSARAMEKLASKAIGANAKYRPVVEFGALIPTIKKLITKEKLDVIVMGTHGASGLKEYTIGSNAEKVVRNSTIPVIAVRKAGKGIKNIVFPTDGNTNMEELTMKVKELQSFYDAKLHLLFVNTPAAFRRDSESRPALERFAKRFMLKNCTLNVYSDISEEEGIINFTRQVGGDLVAMRTHGHRGLVHLANGSIAEDVVNHIECPIWTFKVK